MFVVIFSFHLIADDATFSHGVRTSLWMLINRAYTLEGVRRPMPPKSPLPPKRKNPSFAGCFDLVLAPISRPLARPFRLLGELFGKCVRHADFLTPQKSRLTHLYIIQGEGRIRWGEKPPPIYIYMRGKIWVFGARRASGGRSFKWDFYGISL